MYGSAASFKKLVKTESLQKWEISYHSSKDCLPPGEEMEEEKEEEEGGEAEDEGFSCRQRSGDDFICRTAVALLASVRLAGMGDQCGRELGTGSSQHL